MKLSGMEAILRKKLEQHTHIKKKLLETGEALIIEASKDDSFWGWGSEKTGQNNHGNNQDTQRRGWYIDNDILYFSAIWFFIVSGILLFISFSNNSLYTFA